MQAHVPVRSRFSDAGGLWQRPNHFADRAACLMTFSNIFGRMPLKYSTLSASRDVADYSEAVPDIDPAGHSTPTDVGANHGGEDDPDEEEGEYVYDDGDDEDEEAVEVERGTGDEEDDQGHAAGEL